MEDRQKVITIAHPVHSSGELRMALTDAEKSVTKHFTEDKEKMDK